MSEEKMRTDCMGDFVEVRGVTIEWCATHRCPYSACQLDSATRRPAPGEELRAQLAEWKYAHELERSELESLKERIQNAPCECSPAAPVQCSMCELRAALTRPEPKPVYKDVNTPSTTEPVGSVNTEPKPEAKECAKEQGHDGWMVCPKHNDATVPELRQSPAVAEEAGKAKDEALRDGSAYIRSRSTTGIEGCSIADRMDAALTRPSPEPDAKPKKPCSTCAMPGVPHQPGCPFDTSKPAKAKTPMGQSLIKSLEDAVEAEAKEPCLKFVDCHPTRPCGRRDCAPSPAVAEEAGKVEEP